MGKQKSNSLVFALLIVCILVLGGFILYDKVFSNKPENNNTEESIYTTICYEEEPKTFTVYGDVSKYSNIFDYIADQKEVTAELNYCTYEVESTGDAGDFYKTANYTLTSEELTNFLNEMKNGTSKYLSGGFSSQCDGTLTLTYKNNGNENIVKIFMLEAQILSSTDGNIYKIIDSNVKEKPAASCYYSAGTSSKTVTNIINRLN